MAYEELHRAMVFLRDGSAFSRTDAGFGRSVAGKPPSAWTPFIAQRALLLTEKYRLVLREINFDPTKVQIPKATSVVSQQAKFVAAIKGDTVTFTSGRFPGNNAVAAVKALPGRRYLPASRAWSCPLSNAPKILQLVADGFVTADSDTIAEFRKRVMSQRRALADSSLAHSTFEIAGLGGELMPFQRAGVAFALEHKRLIIGDEMGLGKTVQALAVIHAARPLPAIVICPASLKLNWERETRRWIPWVRSVLVLSGMKPQPIPRGTEIVIINYDILAAWAKTLMSLAPRAVVLDEVHEVKSPKAKRTLAARQVVDCPSVVFKLGLTGTPVLNGPQELLSILRILGRLNDMGGRGHFVDRFCIKSKWGGFDNRGRNLAELNGKLREIGAMVRRRKSDVLTDLPDKRVVRVPVALEKPSVYATAFAEARAELLRAKVERQQAASQGRRPEGWATAAAMTVVSKLLRAAAEAKLSSCIDWMRNMLETGEKLVVFAYHVSIVESIATAFSAPLIHGATSAADRQAAVDRFQNDPSCRVIVLNLRAGSVGLTLTAASNVVFLETAWTPGMNSQAEDRCHRLGQRYPVTCWYLEATGTVDEWKANLVTGKAAVVDKVTEGDEAHVARISQELADMIERGKNPEKRS